MYEVTIAIPLYNAEKYIQKTLYSALSQSFKSIEFLIVDDKSTDKSIELIQKIQLEHPRGKDIRIVSHSINKGVGATRNTLLKKANGKYLFFLDSDDLISPNCILLLYEAAIRWDAEMVIGSHENCWDNKRIYKIISNKIFTEPEAFSTYCFEYMHSSIAIVWNKLYDLSFLRETHLVFKEIRKQEDVIFMYQLIPLVTKCVTLSRRTYKYVIHPDSLCCYNYRNVIPIEEIRLHFFIRECLKEEVKKYQKSAFIEAMVTGIMHFCLDAACVIIDKRKIISEKFSYKEIKTLLIHPLPYYRIKHFKKYKTKNIFYYALGRLPYLLLLIGIISYLKGVKFYRKLK